METDSTSNPTPAPLEVEQAVPAPQWSKVWQLPALMLGVMMLGTGLYLHWPQAPTHDFPGAIASLEAFLEQGELESAEHQLKAIAPHIQLASLEQQAQFDALWGDLIFAQQDAQGWNLPANHQRVLALYHESEELGLELTPERLIRKAQSLVALGREEQALRTLDQLKDEPAARRYRLIRHIIQQRQADLGKQVEAMASLIDRYTQEIKGETDPAIRRSEEIWATVMKARNMFEAGDAQRTIEMLHRRIMSFMDRGGDADLAPLFVLLAQAYQQTSNQAEAERLFLEAQKRLSAADPLNAAVLVGLAKVELSRSGDVRNALELYARAETDYPQTPWHLEALIGRADGEARLGDHGQALEHFAQAVQHVTRDAAQREKHLASLMSAISLQFDALSERGEDATALAYLELLPRLYGGQELPADMLLRFATTHQKLGQERLTHAQSLRHHQDADDDWDLESSDHAQSEMAEASQHTDTESADAHAEDAHAANADQAQADHATSSAPGQEHAPPASTDHAAQSAHEDSHAAPGQRGYRLAFQEAALQFGRAADYFLRHSRATVITDEKASGLSLWKAAGAFDQAQLWKQAIGVYQDFVRTRPNDPRHLEAQVRLGLAYQADGQTDAAISLFKQLIENQPRSPEAYACLVPLARGHLTKRDYDAALRVLQHVVQDHPAIDPQSAIYRQALIELGKLYYRQSSFERAIERLSEAVNRYSDDPQAPILRFYLASAYRQSVPQLQLELNQPQPTVRKEALQAERIRRLESAQQQYDAVIQALDPQTHIAVQPTAHDTADAHDAQAGEPHRELSAKEQLFLRNAYFYRADCAYDLRRFEQAIQLYDSAAKRWEHHPASLVALVQIVNAYCEMGRLQEARVANDRARWQLQRIPEEAFNDPGLPMNRQHWEDWLKWTTQANLFGARGAEAAQVDSP